MKRYSSALLSGHAYLTSLLINFHIFADEVDKFNFLKMLSDRVRQSDCRVVSFSLMDDSLNMIFVAPEEVYQPDQMVLTGFNQDFLPYFQRKHSAYPLVRAAAQSRKIETMEQLLREVNELHFLPRKMGIVEWITDYWWSGIQNYLGHHGWDFVEPDFLILELGRDQKRGKKYFQQCARQQYQEEFGTLAGYSRV